MYYDETNVGVADMLFGSANFWLSCLAVVALTAGSRCDPGAYGGTSLAHDSSMCMHSTLMHCLATRQAGSWPTGCLSTSRAAVWRAAA